MVYTFPPGIVTWLWSKFQRAEKYQKSRGIIFDLTFLEYQALWKRYLQKLSYWQDSGRLDKAMRHRTSGLVLSWRSKQDRKAGVMNATTARVIARKSSETRFYMQPGEKHSQAAKDAIGKAQRGRGRSDEHKAKISRARTGRPQSKEQVAKRVAATKATKERNRSLAS